jgi:succinyl-CoA synthetase beta subunit
MSLNIHEHQAKEIFKRYNIPVNQSGLARTAEEAFQVAKQIDTPDHHFAVKAQVHAGGRGKGGGIKIVKTPEEVREAAAKIIGMQLITPQTGPEGKPVHSVLIEATSQLKKEFYTSVVLDRSAEKPCLMISAAGGMDIEEVAHKEPDKIFKHHFSLDGGLTQKEAETVSSKLDLTPEQKKVFAQIFQAMSKVFLDLDASLVEINPLSVIGSGKVVAIDAKINFDDNAMFRHPEIAAMFDATQEDPREIEAKKFDLSYVGLDGNIGCIVNGAGLAMATMDIIKYAGGEPANFLDVGGGANKEKVAAAFKIILHDPKVKAILVNIFGGIMRCDVVAEGILAAINEVGVKVPLVVRLEGTNVAEGKEMLKKSGLNIIAASKFEEAAEKVVRAL